jgi:hypothetical protein
MADNEEPAAAPAEGAAPAKRALEEAAPAEGAAAEEPAAKRAHTEAPASAPDAAAAAAAAAAAEAAAARRAALAAHASNFETVYRLVVDLADTALLIGRGGSTVRAIEGETGARVKRLQEPPGAREQVIVVWSRAAPGLPPGEPVPAQRALADCARRVVLQEGGREAAAQGGGGDRAVRLLVGRSQEAGLAGLAESLRAEGGVALSVLRGEDLPPCALENDVLVELLGGAFQVLAAVDAVAAALRAAPPTERPGGPSAALAALAAGGGGGRY